MQLFIILSFITSVMSHAHHSSTHSSSGHSSSGHSSSSHSSDGITHNSDRSFTYKIATTKKTSQVIVSYFATTNFINILEKNYIYGNNNNFSTYNIYYYSKIDNLKCIYFNSQLNNLDYTFIDYSNINLINNTNIINYNLINKRYCEKMTNTNYILIVFIIVIISIICCYCICISDNNRRNLL